MAESRRTYRVPKRIAESASVALIAARSSGVGMGDISAVTVAQALAANLPVSLDVPRAINEFFSPGWRYDADKVEQVAFHGGDMGRLWAKRCTTSAGAVTAAGEVVEEDDEDDDLDEPDEPLDEAEFQRLLDYYGQFPGGKLPEASSTEPNYLPDSEYVPAEEVEDAVDTALGLATQLDETVEKLAEALEDALVPVDDDEALVELDGYFTADELRAVAMESMEADGDGALVPPPDSWFSDEEREEARMVRAALAAVIRGGSSLAAEPEPKPDLNEAAKAAKERIGAADLQRKRSLAMARMAAKRLNLPTTLESEEAEPAPEAEAGGEPPKDSAAEPHAARQPRTSRGRFTGIGTRVRDRKGREGTIMGTVGRRAVIQGDDGEVRLMEPEDFEVAKQGRAVLRQKPRPVDSPARLLRGYLDEMRRRMGVQQ